MRKIFASLIVGLSLYAPSSFATISACNKNYLLDVVSCSKSVIRLPLRERREALKACLIDANTTRISCISGPSVCQQTCQTTYNQSIVTCEQTHDVSQCGDSLICQQITTQQLNDCKELAQEELDICNLNCQ